MTVPRSAFHPNAAAMLLKNAARDPQAQACANVGLGGEKWLEDIFSMPGFNSAAGVKKSDANSVKVRAAPVVRFCGAQHERTALRHGVNSVGDQV